MIYSTQEFSGDGTPFVLQTNMSEAMSDIQVMATEATPTLVPTGPPATLPIARIPRSTIGVAPVKPELVFSSSFVLRKSLSLGNRYILSSRVPQPVIDDDAAECKTNNVADGPSTDVRDRRDSVDGEADGDGNKRQKLSKEEKKARTGQNKGRRFKAMQDEVKVCKSWVQSGVCDFGDK